MTKFVNPLSSNTMLSLWKGVYTTPNFYWSVGLVPLQNARLSRQAIDLLSKCILRLLIKDSHFHFISIYLKNGGNKPTKHKSQTGYKSAFFRFPFAFARPHNNNWHPLKNPLSTGQPVWLLVAFWCVRRESAFYMNVFTDPNVKTYLTHSLYTDYR